MKINITAPEENQTHPKLPALYKSEQTGNVFLVTEIFHETQPIQCEAVVVKLENSSKYDYYFGEYRRTWDFTNLKRLPVGTILTLEQS